MSCFINNYLMFLLVGFIFNIIKLIVKQIVISKNETI